MATRSLMTIPDVNNLAEGMMFSPEYIVYKNFDLLKKINGKLCIGFVGMVYITDGRISVTLNGTNVLIKKDQLMLFKAGDYLSDPMFSVDSKGWIFATSEILTVSNKDSGTFTRLYTLQDDHRVFDAKPEFGRLIELYGRIAEEKFRMGYYDICLTSVALANDIMQNIILEESPSEEKRNNAGTIYQRFNALLLNTIPKPREVKWYAEALSVTPKYLTTITKRLSGRCVSDWIDEAVIADIRRLMIHTEESMKQIAAIAGFNNAAFFGKYVKSHTGMTPIQLKKKLRSAREE